MVFVRAVHDFLVRLPNTIYKTQKYFNGFYFMVKHGCLWAVGGVYVHQQMFWSMNEEIPRDRSDSLQIKF